MSADNNELLMLLSGKKKSKQTIGVAGKKGFGVGVYGGDEADLTAMGLSPMYGCDDPASDNYGNYIHTNGSIMCFIPAFCYRIGNSAAPSYSRDTKNALEIRDAALGEGDGWILHRAFIDGDKKKLGFFVDKYLCSKKSGNANIAVSVKNANQISLGTQYENSSDMTDCYGGIYDAITLSRARGNAYACVSAFQWSALSMLSLAHGQAATSVENCAWYDADYIYNFPKGSNNAAKDINDSSVTFAHHVMNSSLGKTGSGTPFAKTTHNGQVCGVADVNGCMLQPLLGICPHENYGSFWVAKESRKMHDFALGNFAVLANFDAVDGFSSTNMRWGSGSNCVFTTETSGSKRAMCGVFPVSSSASPSGTALFGNDFAFYGNNNKAGVILASGSYANGSDAGVWCRYGSLYWDDYSKFQIGFRAAGYAQ